jgi:hypothetical protein
LLGRFQDLAIHLVAISELGAAVWGDGFPRTLREREQGWLMTEISDAGLALRLMTWRKAPR